MVTAMQADTPADLDKQRALRQMKLVALALLLAAAAIYVIATAVGPDGWVGYVQAFAEAAMVGALADWFAVTALFRHPLGIPIPHTAIIPKRKDQIGRSLGEFVEGNFLTHEVLSERLAHAGVGRRLGHWLSQPHNAAPRQRGARRRAEGHPRGARRQGGAGRPRTGRSHPHRRTTGGAAASARRSISASRAATTNGCSTPS